MKTALIVGGTSGLGRKVAWALDPYYEVLVAARKPTDDILPFFRMDIQNVEDRARLVKALPTLDALVITAGGFCGDVEAVNYRGPRALAMDFAPSLAGGSVTFVSSTAVMDDTPYGKAKRELEYAVEELAGTLVGVRVNAVRPCAMRGGHAAPLPEDGSPIVNVEDVADAVCFLVRNSAIHGVVLPVDRGVSL